MALNHSSVVSIPDDPAISAGGGIVSSKWNAEHVVAGTANGVLFNDGGLVGSDAGLTYDKTTDKLMVGGGMAVGTTPKAWAAGQSAIDIGPAGHLVANVNSCEVGANLYYDNAWRYRANGAGIVSDWATGGGLGTWSILNAPSGTAGAVATLTQRLILNEVGNLGITGKMTVANGSAVAPSYAFGSTADTGFYYAGVGVIGCAGALALPGNAASALHAVPLQQVQSLIAASPGGGAPGGTTTQVQFNDAGVFAGDVGLTYDKTTDKLTVGGGMAVGTTAKPWHSSQIAIDIGPAGHLRADTVTCEIGSNLYYDGGWKYRTDGPGIVCYVSNGGGNSAFGINIAPTGVAGAAAAPVEKARIDAAGNLSLAGGVYTADGSASAPTHSFSGGTNTGFHRNTNGAIYASANGVLSLQLHQTSLALAAGCTTFGWTDAAISAFEIAFRRVDANTIEVNNGTPGQYRDFVVRSLSATGPCYYYSSISCRDINTNGYGLAVGGISFGSVVAASTLDLSKHINLYGGTYGFNITSGRLNVIANGTVQVAFDGPTNTLYANAISCAGITSYSLNTQGNPLYAGTVSCTTLNTNGSTITCGSINAYSFQATNGIISLGCTGDIAGGSAASALQAQGAGGGAAAYMAFHRPGAYAAFFGIDSDNQWKVGGWSQGASKRVWHEGISFALSYDADTYHVNTAGRTLTVGRLVSSENIYATYDVSVPRNLYSKGFIATTYQASSGAGNQVFDWNNGTSQIWQLSGAVNFWTANTPIGSILRVVIYTGGNAVTINSGSGYDYVYWPMGVAPNLNAGPIKWCVVTFVKVNSNSTFANASVY